MFLLKKIVVFLSNRSLINLLFTSCRSSPAAGNHNKITYQVWICLEQSQLVHDFYNQCSNRMIGTLINCLFFSKCVHGFCELGYSRTRWVGLSESLAEVVVVCACPKLRYFISVKPVSVLNRWGYWIFFPSPSPAFESQAKTKVGFSSLI